MSPHPYQQILSDPLSIIFEYYIQEVYKNVKFYSKEALRFFTKHIRCWRFGCDAKAKKFLERTRGSKLTLYYVDVRNKWFNSETFPYFRGIHELEIQDFNLYRNMKSSQFEDDDFVNLRGIHTLNISGCRDLSDAALVHLRGIHKLNIKNCEELTDVAFVNLRGVHTLIMSGCVQITDKALENLRGIHTLNIGSCGNVTDAGLENLRGIHTIDISGCNAITDAGLVNLRGIHTLCADDCDGLTGACLVHLRGIQDLEIDPLVYTTNAQLVNVRGLKRLWLRFNQFSSADLENIRSVDDLSLFGGESSKFDALRNLRCVKNLSLFSRFTGEGFENLRRVEKLVIEKSSQSICEALLQLHALKHLTLNVPSNGSLQDKHFANLHHLEVLEIHFDSKASWLDFTGEGLTYLHALKRLHLHGYEFDWDRAFASYIPQDLEVLDVPMGKFSPEGLRILRGIKTIRASQLHIDKDNVEHAKNCLRAATLIVADIVGTGAREMVEYLQKSECEFIGEFIDL